MSCDLSYMNWSLCWRCRLIHCAVGTECLCWRCRLTHCVVGTECLCWRCRLTHCAVGTDCLCWRCRLTHCAVGTDCLCWRCRLTHFVVGTDYLCINQMNYFLLPVQTIQVPFYLHFPTLYLPPKLSLLKVERVPPGSHHSCTFSLAVVTPTSRTFALLSLSLSLWNAKSRATLLFQLLPC